jgi:two-component system chemotaxis sensor kinase CheA
LIRNSLDHGLETPEERSQQGKTEEGTLELECFLTQDQNLSISLRDDGRGIDGEKILKKALQGGKISLSAAEKLSPQERQELIYLPSFSTKEVATDLSGRGVGMDVVKSNIETLGGRLILNSTLGKGTEFVILINPRTERLTT